MKRLKRVWLIYSSRSSSIPNREVRCGQTVVWGATLSTPALRYFDLAAVEKTWLSFVDCEAFRRIPTIAQDPIAGENRATVS